MSSTIQARLDQPSQKALAKLVKRLGWSPSKVVREGLRLLAACHVTSGRRTIHGQGKFASGVGDLSSNKKHMKGLRPVKPVLLDTGSIVALLDSSDSFHDRCADAIGAMSAPLVTCEPVIAESCYLLRDVEGAAEAILHSVETRGFLIPIALSEAAVPVRRIMAKYRDRNIDLADAFLIHLANQFSTGEILTVDSDFQIYRWGRNNRFQALV